jgi:predicted nucleotidyltransferase
MLKDCDSIQTKNGDFYIVKGYYQPEHCVYATKTFKADPWGDRENDNGLKYKKVSGDVVVKVPRAEIKEIILPEESKTKDQLWGVWQTIYETCRQIGIAETDIGIFGSGLLGFPLVKDVDFIVYGPQARTLLRQNIGLLKDKVLGGISDQHIAYQVNKYAEYHNPNHSNFQAIYKNKWSSLQITPTVLSTIRFGYRLRSQIPPELIFDPDQKGDTRETVGIVTGNNYCDYTPRVFEIITEKNKSIWVKTLFWSYQSCVNTGDKIKVKGVKNETGVYLTQYDHGIIIGK